MTRGRRDHDRICSAEPAAGSTVLISAVVWNVNHLAAAPEQAEDYTPRTDEELQTDLTVITGRMQALAKALGPAADEARKSGEAEAEAEEDLEDEESADAGATAWRAKPGQLNTDIVALVGEDLNRVIKLGLTDMRESAGSAMSSVDEGGRQLSNVRRLNRVWNRLSRVRGALDADRKGTVLDELSEEQRDEVSDEYVNTLAGWFEKDKKLSADVAMGRLKELVSPLGISATWDTLLGGGKISVQQFDRNTSLITMDAKLHALGYRIVGGVAPTNPKDKGVGENKMQVADFFIANKFWQTAAGGIVSPENGAIKRFDREKLPNTKVFWRGSDHSPAAVVASTEAYDDRVADVLEIPRGASEDAKTVNLESWDTLAERLTEFQVMDQVVRAAIDTIKQAVGAPLTAPTADVAAAVDKYVDILFRQLKKYHNRVIKKEKPAWVTLLDDIHAWSPAYGQDFSEDKMESAEETDDEEALVARRPAPVRKVQPPQNQAAKKRGHPAKEEQPAKKVRPAREEQPTRAVQGGRKAQPAEDGQAPEGNQPPRVQPRRRVRFGEKYTA